MPAYEAGMSHDGKIFEDCFAVSKTMIYFSDINISEDA